MNSTQLKELRVFDASPSRPGEIQRLDEFLAVIDDVAPGILGASLTVCPGAYGYGLYVVALEERSERAQVIVLVDELRLELGHDNYFYDCRLIAQDGSFGVGLADTTYVYFRGEATLVEQIQQRFKDTSVVDFGAGPIRCE